jgi:hypothetical protein
VGVEKSAHDFAHYLFNPQQLLKNMAHIQERFLNPKSHFFGKDLWEQKDSEDRVKESYFFPLVGDSIGRLESHSNSYMWK